MYIFNGKDFNGLAIRCGGFSKPSQADIYVGRWRQAVITTMFRNLKPVNLNHASCKGLYQH
jgi:hypothetical protein